MSRRRLAVLALCISLAACGRGITWEHTELYDNGQLRVLPGKSVFDGQWDQWEGPWLWFNRDGSIMYSETFDGRVYDRTGFYEHGKKTRELTTEELRSEMKRAEHRQGR